LRPAIGRTLLSSRELDRDAAVAPTFRSARRDSADLKVGATSRTQRDAELKLGGTKAAEAASKLA
jgi:hypothetical protein